MTGDDIPLQVDGICASYQGVPAIDNVSLRLRRGSITTVIGANGAGKSTVIKCICGLVPTDRGKVRLFGQDVTGMPPDELVRRGLSVVPEGRRLFSDMTLRENLELGAYTRSDATAVARDLERVLTLFPDLRDRMSTMVNRFSGGQQQMVAVARAMMSAPRVMLLDEPTIGLAPVIVERIGNLIGEISRSGVTVLFVEQNAEIALEIADDAYILESGKVIAEDTAANLAQTDEVKKAYLGV